MDVRLTFLFTVCIPVLRALRVTQPYRAMALQGAELRLSCFWHAPVRAEEVLVTLYRGMHGGDRVCSSTLNLTTGWQVPHEWAEGPVFCASKTSPDGVDLLVSGLHEEDTDFYRCKVEVLYPPPYRIGMGNGTLLHIQAEKPNCPELETQTQEDPDSTPNLLHVAVITVFVIAIVIIITISVKVLVAGPTRKNFLGVAHVAAKRVDCRFGYENFL